MSPVLEQEAELPAADGLTNLSVVLPGLEASGVVPSLGETVVAGDDNGSEENHGLRDGAVTDGNAFGDTLPEGLPPSPTAAKAAFVSTSSDGSETESTTLEEIPL